MHNYSVQEFSDDACTCAVAWSIFAGKCLQVHESMSLCLSCDRDCRDCVEFVWGVQCKIMLVPDWRLFGN